MKMCIRKDCKISMNYDDCMQGLLLMDREKLLRTNLKNQQYKDNSLDISTEDMILDTSLIGGFRVTYENSKKRFGATKYVESYSNFTGDLIFTSYCKENVPILDVFDLVLNHNAYIRSCGISLQDIFNIIENNYFKEYFNELHEENLDTIIKILDRFKAEEISRLKIEADKRDEELRRIKLEEDARLDKIVTKILNNKGITIYEYAYNHCDYRYYNIEINGQRGWYTYMQIKQMFNIEDEHNG